jgi:hypothetical protein
MSAEQKIAACTGFDFSNFKRTPAQLAGATRAFRRTFHGAGEARRHGHEIASQVAVKPALFAPFRRPPSGGFFFQEQKKNEHRAAEARLVELNETGKAIQAKADAEKRELTAEEQTRSTRSSPSSSRSRTTSSAASASPRRTSASARARGRVVPPQNDDGRRDRDVVPQPPRPAEHALRTREERARWGFRDFGEFCSTGAHGAAINPAASTSA